METKHNIRLTSAEISNLWSSYVLDSMAVCVLRYFLEKVEDSEIKPIVQNSLAISQKHIETLTKLFDSESIPTPVGFTESDVNTEAPRLYSDVYILQYIKQMARTGMLTYSLCLYLGARSDVRDYYKQCLASSTQLENQSTKVLLDKGLYIRSPYLNKEITVDFVRKTNFITGWFSKQRPLLAMEITSLYLNILTNSLGKALIMGFSQVAQSKEVRSYFVRGKEIANKQIAVCSQVLHDEDLPAVAIWDSEVTDSTIAPFSDKLMMFHTTSLTALGISDFGLSLANSSRKDLAIHYHRLMAEIETYVVDGTNIMINNGWLEQPPQSVDRKELVEG